MTNTKARISVNSYLHVMPRYAVGHRWHVFQINDESPRIEFAESVTSYLEVHRLGTANQRRVRFSQEAWQQMVAAGVAPKTVPDDVTVV